MATFQIGQRVRLVPSEWIGAGPSPDKQEGRIHAVGAFGKQSRRWFDYGVTAEDGREVSADAHELEPIIPEGAAPSEFTTLADLLSSLEVTA